ncbi:hypothetical protein GW17_00026364 [Ensete ventricosum]|nr:hypothetical protein GW17_00026364 [Ensete ventricosum]
MNVGDKHYDPLFPFGYGLTTKPTSGRFVGIFVARYEVLLLSPRLLLQSPPPSNPPRSDASGDRLRSLAGAALIPLAFDPFRLAASSSLCDPGLDLRCSALSLSPILSSPNLFRIDVTLLCLNRLRRERLN